MVLSSNTIHIIFCVFLFVIGACIGSFLNLVAHRLPLHKSIVHPRSHCPSCQKTISPCKLLPIIGYFIAKGRCAHCHFKIPIFYPGIEFFSAAGTTFLFYFYFKPDDILSFYTQFHPQQWVPFLTSLWIFYSGIVLSIIDLKYRILPDKIVLPGILMGLILTSCNPNLGWQYGLYGALGGCVGLYLIAKLYEWIRKKEGIGMGDIKYLGFIGALVGLKGMIFTLFLASVMGSLVGIGIGLFYKKGLSLSIPFGPFLALGSLIVFLAQ